jgi:hypothetical protein
MFLPKTWTVVFGDECRGEPRAPPPEEPIFPEGSGFPKDADKQPRVGRRVPGDCRCPSVNRAGRVRRVKRACNPANEVAYLAKSVILRHPLATAVADSIRGLRQHLISEGPIPPLGSS